MSQPVTAFSGFSVDSLAKAKAFYEDVLGLKIEDEKGMGLLLHLPGSTATVFIYEKENHKPATYTMLNFVVSNIDTAVEELDKKGIKFERYEGTPHDEKGIVRGIDAHMGPDIAWFQDPAGNILSVLQEKR